LIKQVLAIGLPPPQLPEAQTASAVHHKPSLQSTEEPQLPSALQCPHPMH